MAALFALAACKGKILEEGVRVEVTNTANVAGIVQLQATVSNLDRTETLLLPATPQQAPIDFPTAFSISVPSSRTGRVDITVLGLDSSGTPVAHGTAFAILQASNFVRTTVELQRGAPACCTDASVGPEAGADADFGGSDKADADVATDAPAGQGGTAGAGGATASGGWTGSGGVMGSGGLTGSGARPGVGGVIDTAGGVTAPGGITGRGGLAAAGGTSGMGGLAGTGGTTTPVVDCGQLADPLNGTVRVPSTTGGSTATYACKPGYTLSGSQTRTCSSDGYWTGETPACVIVTCPAPTAPANGTVSAPALTFGSVATYACFSGYNLTGVVNHTCQPDGTWDGARPICLPVDCGPLPAPLNGSVDTLTTTFGSSASYSCKAGYRISSNAPRTCQADGTWSGSAPTCTIVDCGALATPTNGAVSATTTTYGSTATYSCGAEFTLSANVPRTCQADGTWSGVAPTCLPWGGMTCATTQDCPSYTACCDGSNPMCDGTMLPVGDGTNPGQFVISPDGLIVTDTITGLVWQREEANTNGICASGESCWAKAKAYCASLVLGGLSGWRLPAVMELSTIVDFTREQPALDPTAFPGCCSDLLFTSTPWPGAPGEVWIIDPMTGFQYYEAETTPRMVRCVR